MSYPLSQLFRTAALCWRWNAAQRIPLTLHASSWWVINHRRRFQIDDAHCWCALWVWIYTWTINHIHVTAGVSLSCEFLAMCLCLKYTPPRSHSWYFFNLFFSKRCRLGLHFCGNDPKHTSPWMSFSCAPKRSVHWSCLSFWMPRNKYHTGRVCHCCGALSLCVQ